jgi:PPOX class probable FMN-dependent enzyme
MEYPSEVQIIKSEKELRELNGLPQATTLQKIIPSLEEHAKNFITKSPFLVVASTSAQGTDASPRGDKPGFVEILSDTRILIPERPGNRIADTLSNILDNPAVGLIFMVPGMNETLRINGKAFLTTEPSYLEKLVVTFPNGRVSKPPKLAILIEIEQVYFHCAKAFVRSKLWDETQHIERSNMPTLGQILLEQKNGQKAEATEINFVDGLLEQDTKNNLY